jgi:Na+-driven multidrug efflux pump
VDAKMRMISKVLAIVISLTITKQCESFIATSHSKQDLLVSPVTKLVGYSPALRSISSTTVWHGNQRLKTSLNVATTTAFGDEAGLDKESSASNLSSNEATSEDQQVIKEQIDAPSVKRIVNFALPAIGIYLCSPLLSTIDTSTVGLLCGTLQQAALNPAITITDYSARCMSFLYTGTTNSIATSKNSKSSDEISEMFLGSLRLAALVGGGLALFLLLSAQKMLVPLVGNDNIEIEILRGAWRYTAIRALGMPAAAMIGTSQAACLGLEDNQTPFRIIVVAAVLNLILDVLFVGRKMAWVGGTAGAAWATTISQYFALFLFFRQFAGSNSNMDESNADTNNDERIKVSTNGLLAERLGWKRFFKLPSTSTIDEYKEFVIPVTTTQIGRCSTYIAMGHVVSSTMDTVNMAAQQIITSIFYTLIPIGDSCGITAQTYLPAILSRQPSQERSSALKKTMKNIFKVAGILGIFLTMIGASIPLMCPLLTQDLAVTAAVKKLVPIMIGILSTHGIFCASEGILLGFKDLKYLGNIYAVFFITIPLLMLRLKSVAKTGASITLNSVWNVFLGYQAFRIVSFLGRAFILTRRETEKPELVNNSAKNIS